MRFFQKKSKGQTCGRTSDPGKRGGKPPSVNATYLRFGIIGSGGVGELRVGELGVGELRVGEWVSWEWVSWEWVSGGVSGNGHFSGYFAADSATRQFLLSTLQAFQCCRTDLPAP